MNAGAGRARPRIIVTGGRDYTDEATVKRVLDAVNPADIAQGGAGGADLLAAMWAVVTGTPLVSYRADWESYGRSAGPIRNQEMLADFKPDLVVAFPGGRGTAHMVKIAHAAGVPIVVAS